MTAKDPPWERFIDCLERKWQYVVTFLNKRPEEPFHFSTRGRILFEVITTFLLACACGFTSVWQIEAGLMRKCDTGTTIVKSNILAVRGVLAGSWGATLLVHFTILLVSSVRFQTVFPYRKLVFNKFRRTVVDPDPNAPKIPIMRGRLAPTVRALRETVAKAKNNEVSLYAATQFLLSPNGRRFLNHALRRMRGKLQLLDGNLVRVNRKSATFSFFLITLLCVTSSLAAAYVSERSCQGRFLFIEFLDKFSFTLLAVFAIASFSGISEYSQIICMKVSLYRLTEDEKFLISLLAANTEEHFSGFAHSESSGYANIEHAGDTEVFLPVHMSLFAYKRAKTLGVGRLRTYNKEADDSEGNYEMS